MEPTLIGPSQSDHHVPVLATDTYHSSFDDLLPSQRVAMYSDSGGTSRVPEAALPVASYIPSTSQVFSGVQARFLNFSIEYRDRTIPLVLKDTEQVGVYLFTPCRHENITFEIYILLMITNPFCTILRSIIMQIIVEMCILLSPVIFLITFFYV